MDSRINDYSPGEELAHCVTHALGMLAAAAGIALLVAEAMHNGASAWRVAGGVIFGLSALLLFTTSVLYHASSSPVLRPRLRLLDHAAIYVLIAGTYTPFGLLAVSGAVAGTLLTVVWSGAVAGIAMHVLWLDAPKWLSAALYVLLGWVGIAAVPPLVATVGWTPAVLLLAGGLLYSLGALVYALRRPDPVPAVFGYHEVFHALVVLAACTHWAAVAMVVS